MWDEARKLFAASPGRKRQPDVSVVAKDLALADVSLGEFLTSKYALLLDHRTADDDRLHGSGRRIENASEGVTIQLTKTAEPAGALNISLHPYGCTAKHRRCAVRLSCLLLIFCP